MTASPRGLWPLTEGAACCRTQRPHPGARLGEGPARSEGRRGAQGSAGSRGRQRPLTCAAEGSCRQRRRGRRAAVEAAAAAAAATAGARARTPGAGGRGRAGGRGPARGARSAPGRAERRRRSEPAPPCFHSRCGAAGRGGSGGGMGGARAAGCGRQSGLSSSAAFYARGLRGCTGRGASAGSALRPPSSAGSKRSERRVPDLRSNSGRRQPAGAALPSPSLPPFSAGPPPRGLAAATRSPVPARPSSPRSPEPALLARATKWSPCARVLRPSGGPSCHSASPPPHLRLRVFSPPDGRKDFPSETPARRVCDPSGGSTFNRLKAWSHRFNKRLQQNERGGWQVLSHPQ